MSDKEVQDGMKNFCDWFANHMKESETATTWKIPLECIPDTKKVWLTLDEAELVNDVLDRFKHLGCGPFFGRCIRLSKSIQQRIEQAEKEQ